MTVLELPNRHQNEVNVRIKDEIAASAVPLDDMSFGHVTRIVETAFGKLSPAGLKAALKKHRGEKASQLLALELGRRVYAGLDEWDLTKKADWDDISPAIFRHCGIPTEAFARASLEAFYVDCQRRQVSPRRAALEFDAALRKGMPSGLPLIECARRKSDAKDPDFGNEAGTFFVLQTRVDAAIGEMYPDGLPEEFFANGRPA